MLKCPYCDSEIESNIPICPHCRAELKPNVKVVKINTGVVNNPQVSPTLEEKNAESKKSYTKYFIVIGVMVIILVILLSLILVKMKPEKMMQNGTTNITTTGVLEKDLTLNTGVFSGKENPVTFGNMTIASIHDENANVTKMVDVMITRYLSEEEVLEIVSTNNQSLKEGFTFVGVEYNVYFHDLGYLGTKTIKPVLKASILESKFFNDYFLVNGHYYKNDVISVYNGPNIKNEESATVKLVYQIPIGQNYYICFGSDTTNLGCFST